MESRIWLGALLTSALLAQPAYAQAVPGQSNGLEMTGGAGIGWTRPACDFCRRDLSAGPVVYLQVTKQITPTFGLGADARFWARNSEAFELVGSIGAVAYLFPTPGGAFHLKGGLSYLSYRAYDDDGDLVSNMPAVQLGAGYRFNVAEGFALTNYVNLVAGRFGTLRSDDAAIVENMGIMSVQLGLALTRF